MDKGEILEVTLTPQDLEMSIGGARRIDISNVVSKLYYTITAIQATETHWGRRIEFVIKDEYDELIVSDWNLLIRKSIKLKDLLNKKISLEPSTNPKKLKLELV